MSRSIAERLRERQEINERQETPLEEIFAEEPPPLDVFVQDKKYLNNPPLSPVQYEVVRHLEQIYLPDTYPMMVENFGEYWDPYRFINFAWIEWGKGSGKDHICRISNARVIHLLLCLKSPQDYFNVPQQDSIHTLNVAASATQANRVYFVPFKSLVRKAPCFENTHPTEYSIRFDKQIEAVSGHSETETQEGLNIIYGVADEISAFKTRDEVEKTMRTMGGREPAKTAESILKMMRTSARTRFPRNFKVAAISYPRFKNDAIQQLIDAGVQNNETYGFTYEEWKAKGSPGAGPSRVLVSGPRATWEVNPNIAGPEDFEEDYDEDPLMARGMYECKPDYSVNRFFRNTEAVLGCFSKRLEKPPITITYHWGRDDSPEAYEGGFGIPEERDGWQVDFEFAPDFVPMQGAIYCLHGDMAINGDRAGVALSHVRTWKRGEWKSTGEDTVMEPRPVVKIDFVSSFGADMNSDPPREVQIRWYRKLVWALIRRGFWVGLATFDNFQSTDTTQILVARGIESKKFSNDRNTVGWDTLRDVMYDDRLEAYYRESTVEELLGLTRLPNGKVDHPPGGSKDEADALAGSIVGAIEMGGDEGEEPTRADIGGTDAFELVSTLAGELGGGFDTSLNITPGDLAPPRL